MSIWTAIDMFCGAGGVTTGMEKARFKRTKILNTVAAINHDPLAIKTHSINHKNVQHYTDDITTQDVSVLPECNILWASIECTNFSNAKGGKPRDPDSRALAEHIPRYINHCNPDYVIIENVREFLSWGPLDKKGKPISRLKGKSYLKWVKSIKKLGYDYDYRFINAADLGAYTSRIRYFGIFAKCGYPIVFPNPTHHKEGKNGLKKWKAVKDKLDLRNEGMSIFDRKKPLSENTIRRIEFGIKKYCLGGDIEEFLIKYYGNGNGAKDVESPCDTITPNDRFAKIKTSFVTQNIQRSINAASIDKPLGAILTKDEKAIVTIEPDNGKFILYYYGREDAISGINKPANVITCDNRQCLVDVRFLMDTQWGKTNRSKLNKLDKPANTITTADGHKLIVIKPGKFIINYNFNSKAHSLKKPAPTVICQDRQALVDIELKEQFIKGDYNTGGGKATSIEQPLGSVMPVNKHSLITVLKTLGIIKDIKMRFLTTEELKKIQGFPNSYKLLGSQKYQKKFIGNSVVPMVAKKIIEALYKANVDEYSIAA